MGPGGRLSLVANGQSCAESPAYRHPPPIKIMVPSAKIADRWFKSGANKEGRLTDRKSVGET
jgi:hypothetical protein